MGLRHVRNRGTIVGCPPVPVTTPGSRTSGRRANTVVRRNRDCCVLLPECFRPSTETPSNEQRQLLNDRLWIWPVKASDPRGRRKWNGVFFVSVGSTLVVVGLILSSWSIPASGSPYSHGRCPRTLPGLWDASASDTVAFMADQETWGVRCPTNGEWVELPWPPEMTELGDDRWGFDCMCGTQHTVTVAVTAVRAVVSPCIAGAWDSRHIGTPALIQGGFCRWLSVRQPAPHPQTL